MNDEELQAAWRAGELKVIGCDVDHLPLAQGTWNTDEHGRTLSGPGVCSTCEGGGCRDCIG
jgi:hypothetical protein